MAEIKADFMESGVLTKDILRKQFSERYGIERLQPNDVHALEGYVAIECARHDQDGANMQMRLSSDQPTELRVTKDCSHVKCAFIRVDGRYFDNREAISFYEDGFVGFAGWADSKNERPFLRAFWQWMNDFLGVFR